MSRKLDAVAVGTCYVDTNVENFPFSSDGIVGEELIGEQYEVVPGGSAVNFCRLGSDLGLRTAFIGMAGTDANGDTLEHLLKQQGVEPDLIRRPELLTNIGFNVTNPEHKHILFVAGTANATLDPSAVLPKLEEILPEAKMLYLGGCLKLKSFMHAFSDIADLAHKHSTQLVVDHGRVPEGAGEEMLEAVRNLVLRAAYYFPSREEFCRLWNVPDIDEGLRKLNELAPELTVVVKDGANGAFYRAGNTVHQVKTEKIDKIVNATGAGDSFNAGVITALLCDTPLDEAITYGNKVAAAKLKAEPLPTLH